MAQYGYQPVYDYNADVAPFNPGSTQTVPSAPVVPYHAVPAPLPYVGPNPGNPGYDWVQQQQQQFHDQQRYLNDLNRQYGR